MKYYFRVMLRNVFILLITIALFFTGCTSTVTVTEEEAGKMTDISTGWSDTDSQIIAAQIVNDMINRDWLPSFVSGNNRNPVINLTDINNLSNHPVAIDVFRKAIIDELKKHQTVSVNGNQADFTIRVEITATDETYRQNSYIAFFTEFSLKETATGDIVWKGVRELRKFLAEERPI